MGSVVAGSILIGLGLLFLLAQVFNMEALRFLWPLVVIGIGGVFFAGMLAGGKSTSGLAIPGTILTGIGLLLLLQNLLGRWTSWAYGWTVILMLVGLGIWIMGRWNDNAHQRHSGLQVMKTGFVFFIIFGALFELVIFNADRAQMGRWVFPVLLIGFGLYLLLARVLRSARSDGNPVAGPPAQDSTPPVPPQDSGL
jgi:hypothetical protein